MKGAFVSESARVEAGLNAAMLDRGGPRAVADRLCAACVELLDVDGAALSVIHAGTISRSFGASDQRSRELDELQFTFGEGPCLDTVRSGRPVLVADLAEPTESRWPAFGDGALRLGVRGVFALPVSLTSIQIGALDLFRTAPGALDDGVIRGGLLAAELAALPLLDMIAAGLDAAVDDETAAAWDELTALSRVEVYQAAGMLIAQLGIGPTEALVRLRGYAFAHGRSASEVAWEILDRRLRLDNDDGWQPPGGDSAR